MRVHRCLLVVIIVQVTSALYINGPSITHVSSYARGSPNGIVGSLSNRLPIKNHMLRNMPVANKLTYGNNANMKLASKILNGNSNVFSSAKRANSNIGGQILATNIKNGKATIANKNIASSILFPTANTNTNEPDIIAMPINSGNIANALYNNIPGFKPKIMKLNIGTKNGHSKFANQKYGFEIIADNLEAVGKVAISGRMPLQATVTLNGNLPSEGSAYVDYKCGAPKNVASA